ncbi:MAG TPA: hypothetical protein VLJ58_15385 [Ramlibacter sp.]|nr:hypothetical protein [Ramlibacter sp.]
MSAGAAASGGWLITHDGMDLLHWAGFFGLLIAMAISAWPSRVARRARP